MGERFRRRSLRLRQALELTPKEFALLALLYERAGQVCDKDEIARAVWPECDGVVYDYNIETLVSRLRHKLDQAGTSADAVVTVKKRGYRLAAGAGRRTGRTPWPRLERAGLLFQVALRLWSPRLRGR